MPPNAHVADGSLASRRAVHTEISAALAHRSDRALVELLERAGQSGHGIGGKTAVLELAGRRVFVKRVPLTALELRPEHHRSTANLFDLPAFLHYGVGAVGSPGFGAWRELAVHAMTTDWALSGTYEGFPLLHHWRVLPDTTQLPDELADIDRAVAYWGGDTRLRHRIEALRDSPASLVLFLEHVPHNLHQWLAEQTAAGETTTERACALAERDLTTGISFMAAHGLIHFDAHFENILTDGRRLYFTDFGLALSDRFALSPAEAAFAARHRTYDHAYAVWHLVSWLVADLYGSGPEERAARIQAYARGETPTGVPDRVAALLTRDAPLAVRYGDFLDRWRKDGRETPYPNEEVRRLAGQGKQPLSPPSGGSSRLPA
ncbi:hypothetical protein GCM10010329_31790 [Streptomyces spiroverticillatus]|uniref:Protein kinase domain-containing protein n=1 Tax=Streptomyces finlayi TaxID=67296 RepID=A0A919C9Z7_9ACTN|nr:protein kinase family protein [Streptomyces finlayi]GHA06845.1 hypothetical protein GCM10010329_31790 [Streptomyces spiroverticillatus]GHC90308.1 hypothetical protein GCM10010334_24200 [Streptomyces finlayi]